MPASDKIMFACFNWLLEVTGLTIKPPQISSLSLKQLIYHGIPILYLRWYYFFLFVESIHSANLWTVAVCTHMAFSYFSEFLNVFY